MHDDRCAATVHAEPGARVIGLQFTARSEAYEWQPQAAANFEKITLFEKSAAGTQSIFGCAVKLIQAAMANKANAYFLMSL